jgi:hypothetical protein
MAGMGISLPAGKEIIKIKLRRRKTAKTAWFPIGGSCRLSPGSQLFFPGKRVRNDGIEVLELRSPGQRRTDAVYICHQRGRITGAPRRNLNRKVASACPPHRADNFKH